MVSIGNRDPSFRLDRFEKARIAVEAALADRDITPDITFESLADGGVVAIVVDGEKRLMHLGRDKADAMFRLATLAARPEGRAG